jgi:hypothetical protein
MKITLNVLLLPVLLLMSLTASAAEIRVRVFERGSQVPLANAAVCLGTSARIDQFGANMTDAEGYVTFTDVPRASLLLTVSRQGYMAEQETLVTSAANRMLVMSLASGGGGTPCPLGNTAARVYGSGLSISRFVLDNGAAATADRVVTLNHQLSGEPTQYRASEQVDFDAAGWQAYAALPSFQLSVGPGRKVVYFQVRRHADVNGAVIETLSPVVRDSIVLQ